MGIFSKILGTEKAVDNLLDKDKGLLTRAGSWIGGMHYTEEEKAEANADTREWGIRQLSALEPFKVVQRILAFAATSLWVFVGVNVVAAIWTADKITIESMKEFAFSEYVLYPVLVVFSLYFTGGVLESFKRKGKSK